MALTRFKQNETSNVPLHPCAHFLGRPCPGYRLSFIIAPMSDVQELLELHNLHNEVVVRLQRELFHTDPRAGLRQNLVHLWKWHEDNTRARGGVLDRRDVLDRMHGRSRMTVDPRIPTNTGAEHVGFSPTRQTLLVAPSAKRRDVSVESHEGRTALRRT